MPSSSAIPSSFAARASVACGGRRLATALTCGTAPPCVRQTIAPWTAYRLQVSPVRLLRAVNFTGAGRPFFGLPWPLDGSSFAWVSVMSSVSSRFGRLTTREKCRLKWDLVAISTLGVDDGKDGLGMKRTKVLVSAIFTCLFLALLALQLKQNDLKVDALDAGLLFLAFVACGWTAAESLKVPGIGEVTYLKGEVQRQAGDIETLKFLTANLLPGDQQARLTELAETGTIELGPETPNMSASLEAIGRLQLAGLIEPRPQSEIRVTKADFTKETAKLDWYNVTHRGREYLRIVDKLDKQ